jgi:hypothetical protein
VLGQRGRGWREVGGKEVRRVEDECGLRKGKGVEETVVSFEEEHGGRW